ncbi:hypothetical protein FRB90_002659, partial [Tulasnella sp. 427]
MAICRDSSSHSHSTTTSSNLNRPQSDAQAEANQRGDVLTVNPITRNLETWPWPRYEVSGNLIEPQYLFDYCKPRNLLPLCYCAQADDMMALPARLLAGCVAMIGRANEGGWSYLTCHQYLPRRFLQPHEAQTTCGLHVNLTDVFQRLTSLPNPSSVGSTPSTPSQVSVIDEDDPFIFIPQTPALNTSNGRLAGANSRRGSTPRSSSRANQNIIIPATPSSGRSLLSPITPTATRTADSHVIATPGLRSNAKSQSIPPPSYTPNNSSSAFSGASGNSKRPHHHSLSTASTSSSTSTAPPPSTRIRLDHPTPSTYSTFSTTGGFPNAADSARVSSSTELGSSRRVFLGPEKQNCVSNGMEDGFEFYLDLLYQLDSCAGLDPRSWYEATTVCPDCHVILTKRQLEGH